MHPSGTVVRNCGPSPQPSIGTPSGGACLSLRLCVFALISCSIPGRAGHCELLPSLSLSLSLILILTLTPEPRPATRPIHR
jgi:hypothetical protein